MQEKQDKLLVPMGQNKPVVVEFANDLSNIIDNSKLALGILAVGKILADQGAELVRGVARGIGQSEVELTVYFQYRKTMHERIVPIVSVLRAASVGFEYLEEMSLPVELMELGRQAVIAVAKDMLKSYVTVN